VVENPGNHVATRKWAGSASLSQSVWAQSDPRAAKFVFGAVRHYAFAELTRSLGSVRFIQVGANDGVRNDPLREFILSGAWTGLLVEPGDDQNARLRAAYAGVPGAGIVGVAIWSESGRRPFYIVEGADALSSFSLDTILRHEPKYDDLRGMIRTIEVETLTLDALADRHGVPNPDVVVVDAEGCDDVVLGSFDIEARRPKLVLFEHVHLSPEASKALRDRLVAAGYVCIADRHDVLAIGEGVFPAHLVDFLAEVVREARNN
jgi:FkbM family methyltransferase